jgi:hypothetical protein
MIVKEGPYAIQASSYEQGREIVEALLKLEIERQERRIKEKLNYGHIFNNEKVCDCGVKQEDYVLEIYSDHEPSLCPNYKYHIHGQDNFGG